MIPALENMLNLARCSSLPDFRHPGQADRNRDFRPVVRRFQCQIDLALIFEPVPEDGSTSSSAGNDLTGKLINGTNN